MSYPFPDDIRNPDRKEPNPFADAATENGSPDGTSDNIFQPGASNEYRPVYDTTYAAHPVTVLINSALGLLMTLVGWFVFADYPAVTLLPLLSVAFSIAGVVIGGNDLKGITAGAVANENARWISLGVALGLLGIINSIAILLVGVFLANWFGLI